MIPKYYKVMEATTYKPIFCRNNQLLANGTALVQIEAYLNYNKKYFSTRIYLKPENWDKRHRQVKNHPNAIKLNRQINDFVNRLQAIELDRRNAGKHFTLEYLADVVNNKRTTSFYQFIENEINANTTSAQSTRKNQRNTLNHLRDFRKDVDFEHINYEFLADFEQFMQAKGLAINTINKNMRNIRKYVNLAINKELIDLNKYPFRKFQLKTESTNRTFLTPSEIQAIETLVLPPTKQHLQKPLDMFLFACYTGLRFSDIVTLTAKSLVNYESEAWLYVHQQKTSEAVKIPLYLLFDNKPLKIWQTYQHTDRPYLFDDYTNQYINRCIKEIAQLAGIKKVVTFHTARHTQATYLLYKGVSITTVQKLLGHKKLQTTQIYSKVMDLTIVKELGLVNFG